MQEPSPFPLNAHNYALVDRQQVDPIKLKGWPLESLEPRELANHADILPALIELAALTPEQHIRLANNLDGDPGDSAPPIVCCLLSVPAETSKEHLIAHLSRRLIISSPEECMLLRYYDPRVFPHLLRVFDPVQQSRLFGPVQRWTVCSPPHLRSFDASDAGPVAPWRVTRSQHAALVRVSEANVVLRWFRAECDENTPFFDDVGRLGMEIDCALRKAQSLLPNSSPDDRQHFALHSLRHGADFHRHPDISALIDDLHAARTYADASALIDRDHWQQIHRELRGALRPSSPTPSYHD